MDPSDSRQASGRVMDSPCRLRGTIPQPGGSPRFLDPSFATRYPLSPRWVVPLHTLIASRYMLASSSPGVWPPMTCVSRPKPVQPFGLRLAASPSSGLPLSLRLSPPGPVSLPVLRYLHTTDRSYMPNQQFTWQPPFRLLEWPVSWRTEAHREYEEKGY
jgi:hypothetical protein